MQRKGLAQIPLILGLLVMAIAIPVATKLVQENQDSRRSAVDRTCHSSKPCPAGQRCVSGRCVPTATVTPTSVPQTCTGRCYRNGQSCPCGSAAGNCQDDDICCKICPTNSPRPTTRPTATPMPCANTGQSCSTRSCCKSTDVCTDEGFSSPRCVPRFPTNTPKPTAMPTTGPIVTRVPTGDPGPRPSDKCPGAQACPDETGRILRDCKNPDSDGTSRDTICNTAGQVETCGGTEYCCVSVGGQWTIDMTKCLTGNCTQCSNNPEAKGKGDADCSGFTNLTDYSIWKEDYVAGDLGTSIKNTWQADFNCDGKVDLVNDYLIWKNYYIKTLQ